MVNLNPDESLNTTGMTSSSSVSTSKEKEKAKELRQANAENAHGTLV